MLDPARLVGRLREFSDPDYPSFRGFPPTRDAARQEWAAAFADYFDQVEEALVPPVSGHPSMNTGGVEGAFFAELGLDPTTSAAVAAADFAGAWRQGVEAVTAAGAAVDGGGNSYAFLSWTNASTLYTPLNDTLEALFAAPTDQAVARLTEIADAFHVASSGLVAAVTITSAGGAASGTMAVR